MSFEVVCLFAIHNRCKLLFAGQFKLMTEMFHITHSALHVGLTTTLQRYNHIYRSDMFNILSVCGTSISFACNPVSKFTELVFLAGLLLRNMRRGTDVIDIFKVLLTFPIGL